jgi:hypothetical protein
MVGVKTVEEIDHLFAAEASYGITNVLIKDFLLLNYPIVDIKTRKVIRDREWISKLTVLNGHCYVPKHCRDEIPIIVEFLSRNEENK